MRLPSISLIALALGAGLFAVSTVSAGVDRATLIAVAMRARTLEASASRAHAESMLTRLSPARHWHERLANVLNGTVKDYSESNLIWHYVLLREGGTWKVADMAPQFVPGQGP